MAEAATAVPTFTAYFNPILSALRTLGGSASNAEIDAQVARELALTQDQLALPHKPDAPDYSESSYRCAWARTYLKKVGHITNPRRAFWSLTAQGAAAGVVDPQAVAARVKAELSAEEADAEADVDATASPDPVARGVHLDPRVVADVRRVHAQLLAQGTLVRESVLTDAYARFAARFGPAVLRGLDGETLLTTMHGRGTKDSLVYWLEFKDDDDLPGCFGSIAGGSALKFGLYQSKDDGRWWTGPATEQVSLSIEDAVSLARRQRDQLVAAATLLGESGKSIATVDYDALQSQMLQVAPDVAETAWGHKYLSLLCPGVLDDYHAVDYQRFHLIRLLQRPAVGRYANARAFVALAAELSIPTSHVGANRFFQALVTRLLNEYLDGYVVRPEFALRDMMAFDPTRNPRGRRSPRPRPDLAILRCGRVEQLLDAKYRDLWEQELPRDMLYQLTIYALSQRAKTAAIVYPTLDEQSRTARIEIRDPMTSVANARVELRPLVVPRLAQLLDDVDLSRRELGQLAASLAFEGTSVMPRLEP